MLHDRTAILFLKAQDYKGVIASLEDQIARLRRELLPEMPVSPTEREKQRAVWIELDRVSTYLARIRDRALYLPRNW
jgi:hypothetical protein